MPEDTGFTIEQALAAQRAMRESLGLGEEVFPVPAFIGMVSDEIQQMREAGKQDREIAALIETATGKKISLDEIARFYAPPEQRTRHKD